MDFKPILESVQSSGTANFPAEAASIEYAQSLDSQDPLRSLRKEFIFPTKSSLKNVLASKKLTNGVTNGQTCLKKTPISNDSEAVVYFCGNSLGLQPKAVQSTINTQLATWATIGVYGHFSAAPDSPLAPWQDLAESCAIKMAPVVGARPAEVAMMNTLTANLHLLMASFYTPDAQRHKIILEWKPFPSDYYAIESQIRMHGLDPAKSMVEIYPDEYQKGGNYISTSRILATIDEHADDTALLLLPGLQYYSGQVFDMPKITKYAQDRGIIVGWDLAHAAGNVPVQLHDWNVDFAMWCTYKYLNAGPGAIAGAFVHERHGGVKTDESGKLQFRNRLSGWYGADKSVRFEMSKNFQPIVGAGGFQLSNPSAIDLASLHGALDTFGKTTIQELREKSLVLTAYAEWLLDEIIKEENKANQEQEPAFAIITPRNPKERGAQLSILLRDGLLEKVGKAFEEAGIVCDQRKPGVIRVAPVPIYNNFEDVWTCISTLRNAIFN